ncbi:hypothetical protein ATANTOWER_005921 [Ataeniobius toweri]|uniref:Uncharacterized protein n=1 Tax=Ataeniobius toweri TaxID=208326 RepID=A0ABU7B779_9TELE|nr:hypothetical protein [Ataeniobius toweri]
MLSEEPSTALFRELNLGAHCQHSPGCLWVVRGLKYACLCLCVCVCVCVGVCVCVLRSLVLLLYHQFRPLEGQTGRGRFSLHQEDLSKKETGTYLAKEKRRHANSSSLLGLLLFLYLSCKPFILDFNRFSKIYQSNIELHI